VDLRTYQSSSAVQRFKERLAAEIKSKGMKTVLRREIGAARTGKSIEVEALYELCAERGCLATFNAVWDQLDAEANQ
jgi:hypothetical protein